MEDIDYETWDYKYTIYALYGPKELEQMINLLTGMFTSYVNYKKVDKRFYDLGTKFAKTIVENLIVNRGCNHNLLFIVCCFLPINWVRALFPGGSIYEHGGETMEASNVSEYFVMTRAITFMDYDECTNMLHKVNFQRNKMFDHRLKLLQERMQNKEAE